MYSFRGIPYAKPPVGALRFRKPQPYGTWQTTLNATKFGASCLQLNAPKQTSEDCLFLNIVVPYSLTRSRSRSVMIWVHGGGFIANNGDIDGERFALIGDVIYVSINYRLGPFGFFSTADSASPGNYGLWDQRLAFQWVHDNIADYGGDPNSVTIFGVSAGGGSVTFHSLYPGNRGLFQKVIAQSGVAVSIFSQDERGFISIQANKAFASLNCSSSTNELSMDCMRNLPTNAILSLTYTLAPLIKPVIDGDFLIERPEKILEKKSSDAFKFFSSLDYIVGTLDGDGSLLLNIFITQEILQKYNSSFATGLSSELLCQYFAQSISNTSSLNNSGLADQICKLYRNNVSLAAQGNAILDLLSDVTFRMPATMIANTHYQAFPFNKATYMYKMTRVNPLQQTWYPYRTYPWMQRATHAIDSRYLFDFHTFPNDQHEDIMLAKTMVNYFTNFAKTRYVLFLFRF